MFSTQTASPIPRHIAIIMDGNGRWAAKRLLPRMVGHKKGADQVQAIVEACAERGIEYLTLFAFSSENWCRLPDEVSLLMGMLRTALERQVDRMHDNGIRVKVAGELSRLDPTLQALVRDAERLTENNRRLTLTLCINYGGRWDIMQATRKLLLANPRVEHVTEEDLAPHFALAHAPDPDLLIRTGGEWRISNSLLWQSAYAEFHFTPVFWPDFGEAELDQAIAYFRQRERRFGRTSEQVQAHAAVY